MLAPMRGQALAWISLDPVHWRIYMYVTKCQCVKTQSPFFPLTFETCLFVAEFMISVAKEKHPAKQVILHLQQKDIKWYKSMKSAKIFMIWELFIIFTTQRYLTWGTFCVINQIFIIIKTNLLRYVKYISLTGVCYDRKYFKLTFVPSVVWAVNTSYALWNKIWLLKFINESIIPVTWSHPNTVNCNFIIIILGFSFCSDFSITSW